MDAIVAHVSAAPGTLVLPMTERTTLPLSESRARVTAAGGRLALAAHETVLRAFDKNETTRLAASLGIAVPKTIRVTSGDDVRALAGSLQFPLVVKPMCSESVTARGQVVTTGAPLYARAPDELGAAVAAVAARSPDLLLQEFVPGGGSGWFALMNRGRLRAQFTHRRIRDVRPTGSGSAVRESAHPDPRLREAGLRILEALGWHGVAMVEFRVRPDGTPVFLEVNGRFWNSLALAIAAGVDFPRLLVDVVEKGDCESVLEYPAGVRCRWLVGDVRHVAEVIRGAPAGFPGPFPARSRTILDFLRPVRGTHHDNFTLDDPLPELGDWVDFLGRKLPAALSRR